MSSIVANTIPFDESRLINQRGGSLSSADFKRANAFSFSRVPINGPATRRKLLQQQSSCSSLTAATQKR